MAKYWTGPKPIQCDVCHDPIDVVFIDGRTKMGPWAIMCPDCYRQCGVGIGVGGGQRYVKRETGGFVKTDGYDAPKGWDHVDTSTDNEDPERFDGMS